MIKSRIQMTYNKVNSILEDHLKKESNYLIIEPITKNSIECLRDSLNNVGLNQDFITHLKESFRFNFLNTLV